MKPDSRKYLFDIKHAISLKEDFVQTNNFYEYQQDMKTKCAVERQLGIIGEAVNNYRKIENKELPNSKQIIALRNRIIHAYNNIDDEIIWAIMKKITFPNY